MIRHVFSTLLHKWFVMYELTRVMARLFWRGLTHDNSKLYADEAAGFARVTGKLRRSTYGSEQYKKTAASIKPYIDMHYKRNRHHPEHAGLPNMSIYDLIEMICDWKAAVRRHADGSIERSFEINQKRFNMSDELVKILKSL